MAEFANRKHVVEALLRDAHLGSKTVSLVLLAFAIMAVLMPVIEATKTDVRKIEYDVSILSDLLWLLVPSIVSVLLSLLYLRHLRIWEKTCREIKEMFVQEDVGENLSAAYDEFVDAVVNERDMRELIPQNPDDESHSDREHIWNSAKKGTGRRLLRFWRLHGLFSALGFEVKPKLQDYQSDPEQEA